MSDRAQQIIAPIVILIVMLVAWEGLVAALDIQQFLLPRPSSIVSNLVRVITLTDDPLPEDTSEIKTLLKEDLLFISIPADTPDELLADVNEMTLFKFPSTNGTSLLVEGDNWSPIIQAGFFTLKEALGGLAIGCILGIIVALVTARWTATREALLPFAIAANSMPIIAFAPIANNWFGIDNPFSKMAIVAVMTFFPMMLNTVKGLTSIDARSLELMRSYAASEFEILRKLRMPNALPFLFNGLKISAALSMIGAIVGEYFGGPRIALGVFITQEAALFRFSSAWAAIIIACAIGITLYVIIIIAERLV
ncbi:MAG: ABC transporter permease subunit, partial [Chloroflexota bacterium]